MSITRNKTLYDMFINTKNIWTEIVVEHEPDISVSDQIMIKGNKVNDKFYKTTHRFNNVEYPFIIAVINDEKQKSGYCLLYLNNIEDEYNIIEHVDEFSEDDWRSNNC